MRGGDDALDPRQFEADAAACARHLNASTAPALLLVPELGYDAAADLAKESLVSGKSIRQLVMEKKLLPKEVLNRLLQCMDKAEGG